MLLPEKSIPALAIRKGRQPPMKMDGQQTQAQAAGEANCRIKVHAYALRFQYQEMCTDGQRNAGIYFAAIYDRHLVAKHIAQVAAADAVDHAGNYLPCL